MNDPSDADIELATKLLAAWDNGDGTSKSELERVHWGDGSSHGRRFDRFIRQNLGVPTTRRSRQTDRIADLEAQVRGLGSSPVGSEPPPWEVQLLHARDACLSGLSVWNDPSARFRTGTFSLLFVTAWNSLAISILQKNENEWRKIDQRGNPCLSSAGVEQSEDTMTLVGAAFAGSAHMGLRENIRVWVDLRNSVAHRHLPALDISVIPHAQAGLLNFENVVADEFGDEFGLAECLSVPLQLSGFRDPGVLRSAKKLQAGLPLDVQAILSRAEEATPELLADPTFSLRVAFIPTVPGSGRSPDAVAYFMKPGEVPDELVGVVERYVVLPKVGMSARPNLAASQVMAEVVRRTGFKFNSQHHIEAARRLNVRPAAGEDDRTIDLQHAEYITSFKRYLYSQAWIDLLVAKCSTPENFLEATGRDAVPVPEVDGGD
ncbi:MAG: hypothetical protein JJE52_01510 [Acidimicrobiia bacterium]|nr:hypothetical protein [Acidimicrobiia bacterium]